MPRNLKWSKTEITPGPGTYESKQTIEEKRLISNNEDLITKQIFMNKNLEKHV